MYQIVDLDYIHLDHIERYFRKSYLGVQHTLAYSTYIHNMYSTYIHTHTQHTQTSNLLKE